MTRSGGGTVTPTVSASPVLVAPLVAGLGGTAQDLVERGLRDRAGGRSTAGAISVPDITLSPVFAPA